MELLGFTDLRRRELEQPLAATDSSETIVAIDPEQSLVARAVIQIREGVEAMKTDPDLILLYNGSGILGPIAVLFGWYYSLPVVIRVNGDILRQHREKIIEYWNRSEYQHAVLYTLQLLLTRTTFLLASGFLVVSEELREVVLKKARCPESRIEVVHNPVPDVDPESEEALPVAVDPDLNSLILTVTNLNFRGKLEGAKEMVDAIAPILPANAGYVIAGDGIYHQQLEAYIDATVDEAATRDRIYTPGYIDDVEQLYEAADVFLYISYIDGYPNVVLEAQAAGLPVVANAAHGMVEQIDDGKTGVLIDPVSESAVRTAVLSLLGDQSRRRQMGTAARRQTHRHNAPERIGREMMVALADIVDEPALFSSR